MSDPKISLTAKSERRPGGWFIVLSDKDHPQNNGFIGPFDSPKEVAAAFAEFREDAAGDGISVEWSN